MKSNISRRAFAKTLAAGAAGLGLPLASKAAGLLVGAPAPKPSTGTFAFVMLGDLHFDKLEYHQLDWVEISHPGDISQIHNYSRITKEVHPHLFDTVRETVVELKTGSKTNVPFVLHVGDFVEGLCGNEKLAAQQDKEAVEFVRNANLGVPFLFTKGNHDITGPGAPDAFKGILNPFLTEQAAALGVGKLANDCYAVEHGSAMFCFFDAYDHQSLDWLEATLARRTARHCFIVVHPPVVPYGARSTWIIYSKERERAQREHLLELLGKHDAMVLGGHIHKYNFLARATRTPRGGRFVQLAISSIISKPGVTVAKHVLSGVDEYNGDQVEVEPHFSPATEEQRRVIYAAEAPFIKQFQYADLPGYAVVTVDGDRVMANVFSGTSRQLWKTVQLAGAGSLN